jgi:hypothetical protein
MRTSLAALAAAAMLALPASAGADEPFVNGPDWTVPGHAGIGMGSQTDPSFAWRCGVHRWLSPGSSLGLEIGRHRWEGVRTGGRIDPLFAPIEPFRGLEKGGNELQHAALTLRMHADGVGPHLSAPLLALGVGVYRQVVRGSSRPVSDDSRHDKYRVGVSFALGGAATRGIAPGAEIRFDFVDTEPGPTHYFTISAALLGNR